MLYRGFTPAFLKLAPYTTISLILTEKLSKVLNPKSETRNQKPKTRKPKTQTRKPKT